MKKRVLKIVDKKSIIQNNGGNTLKKENEERKFYE